MNKDELVARLDRMAAAANMLSRLYEEAAETVAGFDDEASYQQARVELFTNEQELADMSASCRWDAS